MAFFNFNPTSDLPAYNMVEARLEFPKLLNDYTKATLSSDAIVLLENVSNNTLLKGSNFEYTVSGGKLNITGGTIEAMTISIGDVSSVLEFSDLAVDAGELGSLLSSDSPKAYDIFFSGDDTISGSGGNDVLRGFSGSDVLKGKNGNDRLLGNIGGDTLNGGRGRDDLNGGKGRDDLNGGRGRDDLNGGRGRDDLNGGRGNDIMSGNGASDVFIFQNGFGNDVIKDFNATNDLEDIDLSGVTQIRHFMDLKNNHMEEEGADVIITQGRNTITLEDVNINDLGRDDFLF